MEQYTEKKTTFFRFEDLRVYHKAMDYLTWVHSVMSQQPQQANNSISNSFIESSKAIALNIAEGSARNKNQFVYYLKMAKSSIRECLVYTSLLYSLGSLNEYQEDDSRNQLMELTKMIGALISSLQRSESNNNHYGED